MSNNRPAVTLQLTATRHRRVRLPSDRRANRQTDMGRGCRLQSDLAARRQTGERPSRFQTHRQTGRGPVSHSAETAYLETIRADGNPGPAAPIAPAQFYQEEQFALLMSISSPEPPVTEAQFIIPLKSSEAAADHIVF